jgi:hypothetical protein
MVNDLAAGRPALEVDSYHFACCLARGCPDSSCLAALEAEKARLSS